MTTPSEYAQNATAALHKVLGIAPGDFDAKGTAIVIERAIKNATHERETLLQRKGEDRPVVRFEAERHPIPDTPAA
jgi:hypothetical protein